MKICSLCKEGRGRAPAKGPVLDLKHRFKKGKKEREKEKGWMEEREKGRKKIKK